MGILDEKMKKQVKEEFKKLKEPVKLLVFSQEFECNYCKETRELLAELAELSGLISLELYDFAKEKEKVERYQIERIPGVVVLSGEQDFGFRYYGVPSGYEFSTLLNVIIMASKGDSGLNLKVKEELKKVQNQLELKIFVIPTCPHCPKAAISASRFAFENRKLKVSIIEATEFPHLAQKYGVMGTPKVVINEVMGFEGALPEPLFVQHLLHAQEHLLEKPGMPVGRA